MYAREEFYQMTQQVTNDALAWDNGGNRQLFTKPSYRKRMAMGFFVQYASQTTGAMVVYLYINALYKNLGETGGIPLILGAAYVTVAAISNFLGAIILDKAGRVTLLGKSILWKSSLVVNQTDMLPQSSACPAAWSLWL